jgi:hypothetical protein
MRFVPLGFIIVGALSALIALAIPISKLRGRVRLLSSLSVGTGFCLYSLLPFTYGSSRQRIGLAGVGILLTWLGLRKYQRDPEGRTPAATIL